MTDDQQKLRWNCVDAARTLAKATYLYRQSRSSSDDYALKESVETFMTELWDWNFSQTEIGEAFAQAIARMNGYAAGQERRCQE